MHIYFNQQELKFIELDSKPGKKIYKIHKPSKDHPFRKMNKKLAVDKQRNYLTATLG